jgi:hypothetical protein
MIDTVAHIRSGGHDSDASHNRLNARSWQPAHLVCVVLYLGKIRPSLMRFMQTQLLTSTLNCLLQSTSPAIIRKALYDFEQVHPEAYHLSWPKERGENDDDNYQTADIRIQYQRPPTREIRILPSFAHDSALSRHLGVLASGDASVREMTSSWASIQPVALQLLAVLDGHQALAPKHPSSTKTNSIERSMDLQFTELRIRLALWNRQFQEVGKPELIPARGGLLGSASLVPDGIDILHTSSILRQFLSVITKKRPSLGDTEYSALFCSLILAALALLRTFDALITGVAPHSVISRIPLEYTTSATPGIQWSLSDSVITPWITDLISRDTEDLVHISKKTSIVGLSLIPSSSGVARWGVYEIRLMEKVIRIYDWSELGATDLHHVQKVCSEY